MLYITLYIIILTVAWLCNNSQNLSLSLIIFEHSLTAFYYDKDCTLNNTIPLRLVCNSEENCMGLYSSRVWHKFPLSNMECEDSEYNYMLHKHFPNYVLKASWSDRDCFQNTTHNYIKFFSLFSMHVCFGIFCGLCCPV